MSNNNLCLQTRPALKKNEETIIRKGIKIFVRYVPSWGPVFLAMKAKDVENKKMLYMIQGKHRVRGWTYKQLKYFSNDRGDFLGLGTHLFVKVPRPGDSEVTFSVFETSCHQLLPV